MLQTIGEGEFEEWENRGKTELNGGVGGVRNRQEERETEMEKKQRN